MSDILNDLKNDAHKVWDDVKEAVHSVGENEEAYLDASHDLFAWANGDLLSMPFAGNASEKDQRMKTLAVMMVKDKKLVSPVAGTVEAVSLPDNTITIAMNDGTVLTIKVCPGCVKLADEAQIVVKPGQSVKPGETLAEFAAPVQTKSKLLLTKPETFDGFTPAENVQAGPVTPENKLITKA